MIAYTAYAYAIPGEPVSVAVQSWQPLLGGRFGEPAVESVQTDLDGGSGRDRIEAAADEVLRQHGFTRTGPWEPTDDGPLAAAVEVSRPLPPWASEILDHIGRETLTRWGATNITAYEVKNPLRQVVRFRVGDTHRHILMARPPGGGMLTVLPGYWVTSEGGGKFQPAFSWSGRLADMEILTEVVDRLIVGIGSTGPNRW
jgi:hypothetical protein